MIATLPAMEWPYMDWAQRLEAAGKRPQNHYYQTWMDLHTSQEMTGFVGWLRRTVDEPPITEADRSRLHRIFRDELLFWEMAYRGEQWPDISTS